MAVSNVRLCPASPIPRLDSVSVDCSLGCASELGWTVWVVLGCRTDRCWARSFVMGRLRLHRALVLAKDHATATLVPSEPLLCFPDDVWLKHRQGGQDRQDKFRPPRTKPAHSLSSSRAVGWNGLHSVCPLLRNEHPGNRCSVPAVRAATRRGSDSGRGGPCEGSDVDI